MTGLKDKVALVTGGSRGIGRAIVLRLAEAGCHVAINFREDSAAAAKVKAEAETLGIRALVVKADMADKGQVDRMVDKTMESLGRIDIIVNNAGIWEYDPIDNLPEAHLRRTIDANLMGVFFLTGAVVPHMKKRRSGSIINISSTAGQRGEPFHSPYAASKGAIISLTKSLAPELAEYGIRVNCVAPGWVDTDMTTETMASAEAEEVLRKIPLGRIGTPDEIAWPVVFLASDMAGFITGEILNVNGGAVLCG